MILSKLMARIATAVSSLFDAPLYKVVAAHRTRPNFVLLSNITPQRSCIDSLRYAGIYYRNHGLGSALGQKAASRHSQSNDVCYTASFSSSNDAFVSE